MKAKLMALAALMLRTRFNLRFPAGLTALLVVAAVFAAAAGAFDSGGKPTATGPDTINWTGNGSPVKQQCGDQADPGQGGYQNGAKADNYIVWVFNTDGGSIAGGWTLTVGGQTYSNSSANQLVTPTVDPTGAFASFDVATTGSGAWILTISHGCSDGDIPPAADLTVTKTADGSFTRTFHWGIQKDVDKTLVEQVGGTATFNYTVSVTHDAGVDSGWKVTGVISVANPNSGEVAGVDVTDSIDDPSATCTVTGGTDATIPAASVVGFPYTCTYSSAPTGVDTNTGTASWDAQMVDDASLHAGHASGPATVDWSTVSPDVVDGSVVVTDPLGGGTLGTVSSGDLSPTAFHYSNTVPVPTHDCVEYPNTATFTTSDTYTTGSASKSVKVCGPALTGALTIGFWQNKNGQKIISSANQAALQTWLKTFHPFSNTPPSGIAGYVATIINTATCGGATCNAMLRAQVLATALNVYFSNPALGGNQIGAPAPIGGVVVDLTKICTNIPTCSSFENDSSVFGGATSLSILGILTYQNTSDPLADAGAVWYGQNKPNQVRAKNVFDAINNQVVFAP